MSRPLLLNYSFAPAAKLAVKSWTAEVSGEAACLVPAHCVARQLPRACSVLDNKVVRTHCLRFSLCWAADASPCLKAATSAWAALPGCPLPGFPLDQTVSSF